ncbi:MAG TPA: DNA-3-methyladenine glycosylase 2 family protein [Methylomirabilota bacterium]|nr:DNA-3-methyladenine glycosylase 2 family protein [Methylomirabilota bacterium]
MIRREIPVEGPFDLRRTLSPLVRGNGDRTIRVASGEAWLGTRTADGPATLRLSAANGTLTAEAWGDGAELALERAGRLVGVESARQPTSTLSSVDHGLIAGLARRHPGVRTLRTEAVFEALVAAIVEQKVSGFEAHRVWHGLVRMYGEPAPGPGAEVGLRLLPAPGTLAQLPYYAYHPLGLERRRADLIRAVAGRAAWFEAIVHLPLAEAYERLLAVPGIGPWTAAEVAVRALGDDDAVSVGDYHVPNLVAWALAGESRGDDARMLELLEPYRGRRALVVRLLELGGPARPRRGPRLAPRGIEAI